MKQAGDELDDREPESQTPLSQEDFDRMMRE